MAELPTPEKLSELIGLIYDASIDVRLWPQFLNGVAENFDTDKAILSNVDPVPAPGGFVCTTGIDPTIIAKWAGSKEHIDTWYRALQTKDRHMSYTSADLCSTEDLQSTAFYSDILKPSDVQHTLGGLYRESEERNWIFAVYRGSRGGEFSSHHKKTYRLLIPHFARAIRTQQLLARAEVMNTALAGALHLSPFGAFILDQNDSILWLNKRAEGVALATDGLTIRYGNLTFWDYQTEKAFYDQLLELRRTTDGIAPHGSGLLKIPRPSGRPGYHLVLSPLNARSDLVEMPSGSSILVLIHDPSEPKEISVSLLEQLYGLTAAEAQICVVLFESGSLNAALDTLQITRNTAKSHLAHIFEKLGVKSQAQLLQLLALGFRREIDTE